MKVVLAEKPSVAQSIARIVGATHKKDGFFEGNGWQVTYAFGHLIQLAMKQSSYVAQGVPDDSPTEERGQDL